LFKIRQEKYMKTYKLVRDILVDNTYDVLVAGGGPAGSAAAVCAARLGAKVLLIEATGCLGGMGTSGLVTAFDPMADGERMLVGGFMREVVETMYKRGFLGPQVHPDFWRKEYHRWTPFKPDGLKMLLDELSKESGVEVRFFTQVIDADAAPEKVNGVILHNIEGYRYVSAKTFIDATGDAILADLCGVRCREAGRDTSRIMPASLCSLYAGIDWPRVRAEEDRLPINWGTTKKVHLEPLKRAIADGHFTQPDRFLPGMFQIGKTLGNLNGGHIFNLNALRCKDLTDGMMLGRKIAMEYTEFYRKYVPGFENIEHVTTSALMGLRESRRIVGEYELNLDDYMARRQFPDQIGVYNKTIDIHPYDCSEEEYERFEKEFLRDGRLGQGECVGIPYGIIVPKGWTNLWVPGRSCSADVKVHGSIRVQPSAAMMGQAAGTAAVQSFTTGQPACDLDTAALVNTLRKAGAYLPQKGSSREMTR
jgi:hypothetical protein